MSQQAFLHPKDGGSTLLACSQHVPLRAHPRTGPFGGGMGGGGGRRQRESAGLYDNDAFVQVGRCTCFERRTGDSRPASFNRREERGRCRGLRSVLGAAARAIERCRRWAPVKCRTSQKTRSQRATATAGSGWWSSTRPGGEATLGWGRALSPPKRCTSWPGACPAVVRCGMNGSPAPHPPPTHAAATAASWRPSGARWPRRSTAWPRLQR